MILINIIININISIKLKSYIKKINFKSKIFYISFISYVIKNIVSHNIKKKITWLLKYSMLLMIFQNGMGSLEEYMPIIIAGTLMVMTFLILKLSLIIVKAEKRTGMKWVGYSFLIQFGVIFAIGSPLMLLGFAGAYEGDPLAIIPIIIIAAAVDLNIINVIHQVGLKRSLFVLLLILVPIVFAMNFLGEFLATL